MTTTTQNRICIVNADGTVRPNNGVCTNCGRTYHYASVTGICYRTDCLPARLEAEREMLRCAPEKVKK